MRITDTYQPAGTENIPERYEPFRTFRFIKLEILTGAPPLPY